MKCFPFESHWVLFNKFLVLVNFVCSLDKNIISRKQELVFGFFLPRGNAKECNFFFLAENSCPIFEQTQQKKTCAIPSLKK